ncbi:hypothetical protein [Aquimarina algicola]|uniref:Uncharacterized protein n=1 Tax=Aquimarina algicola TaxID=2589995 RepID=A0A504J781_9FLAO|nr:hypothetical protein [Aquimarina algicola]TPN82959.1 hypothetical protein FHK87_21270 [Aquimarina algicola]
MKNKNKSYKEKLFNKVFEEIKDKLEKNLPLSQKNKNWLTRQRLLFEKRTYMKGILTPDRIKKLDILIPLLGKDWRTPPIQLDPFDTAVENVKKTLKSGAELDERQSKWLRSHRVSLERNASILSEKRIKALDSLTEYLGYSWRDIEVFKNTSIFNDHYTIIVAAIEDGKEIPIKTQKWLRSQKMRYAAQKHVDIPAEELRKLNELNTLLNLSWEISKKSSFLEEAFQLKEDIEKRKTIEKWFTKVAPFIQLAKVELRYGIPKGTLQKVYRYGRKLDYKWILALDDFRKDMFTTDEYF